MPWDYISQAPLAELLDIFWSKKLIKSIWCTFSMPIGCNFGHFRSSANHKDCCFFGALDVLNRLSLGDNVSHIFCRVLTKKKNTIVFSVKNPTHRLFLLPDVLLRFCRASRLLDFLLRLLLGKPRYFEFFLVFHPKRNFTNDFSVKSSTHWPIFLFADSFPR